MPGKNPGFEQVVADSVLNTGNRVTVVMRVDETWHDSELFAADDGMVRGFHDPRLRRANSEQGT